MFRISTTNLGLAAVVVAVAGLAATAAAAGAAIPAPLAGLGGPWGLAVAGAVYGGYRLVRALRNR